MNKSKSTIRSLDRLAHFLLKFTAIEFAETSNKNLEVMSNDESTKIEKELSQAESLVRINETMKLVANIMQKAESVSGFEFTKEDASTMTVEDIRKQMGIEDDGVIDIVNKLSSIKDILKKMEDSNSKVKVVELSDKKDISELLDLLKQASKG